MRHYDKLISVLAGLALLLGVGAGAIPAQAQTGPAPNRAQTQVFNAFVQLGRLADVSVTTVTQDVSITTLAPVAILYNTGSSYAYVGLASGASTVTAANGIPVPPGTCTVLGATSMTHLQAITATGTTTLQVSMGWGTPGSCGGSGVSGGGGVSATANQGTPNSVTNAWPTTTVQGSYTSYVTPFGEFNVFTEARNAFVDTFDVSLDTTNNWNSPTSAGGGVGATVSPGTLSLATGTTANGYSYITSRPTFPTTPPGYVETGIAMKLPTLASNPTNAYAAWGTFTPTATPTAASPIAEGCGFELQPGGATAKMYVVCYAGSARAVIQDLSAATGNSKQPTDGATHTYYQFFRGDQMYWAIDGVGAANIVATQTSGVNGPNVNTQPVAVLAVAGASTPSASLVLNAAATWVGLTNSGGQIADGTYPYRKATVKASTTAPATTDQALVVNLSPNGNVGNVTSTSVSVTNASTTLAAAASFSSFGKVCVPVFATNGIWIRWDGVAATTAPPAEYLQPGFCASWSRLGGYLPTQAWNAISNSVSTIAVSVTGQ